MKKLFTLLVLFVFTIQNIFAAGCPPDVAAISQISLPYSYSGTTCGFNNNYANAGMCGQTLYGPGDDFLFQLNITIAPATYNIAIGGAGTYKSVSVFSGCPSPTNNPTNCVGTMFTTGFSTTGAGNFTFPSVGTYYIMVDEWPAPQCGAFTLNISPPPTCPGGLGTGVINVPALPYASGAGTTCGAGDDLISANVSACGSTSYFTGEDQVFRFTPTASGNVTITLTSGGSYTGLMLYDGCPFTANCIGSSQDFNGSKSLVACVNAGTTYYLVLDSWTTPVCNAYSNLTISAPGAITGNDFCASPSPIISGAGNLNGVTTGYTPDQPGNVSSVFCGSIENNQWYSFVATATSHTFSFTTSGCTNGWGIQAQVFSVTTTGAPCISCNSFTSMGTCYNPGTTTAGSTTASGLTIGQTYYLMIDGNAGDVCNFALSNWGATTLPLNLLSFNGKSFGDYNKLEWIVASDKNTNFYIIEKSIDGFTFNEINRIKSISNFYRYTYSIADKSSANIEYYRLIQVTYNGEKNYSDIISIEKSKNNSSIKKIVNMLGQEVDVNYVGLKVLIFEDGTIIKTY